MGSPGYGAALHSILDAAAVDMSALSASAAAPLLARDVTVYLADFQGWCCSRS